MYFFVACYSENIRSPTFDVFATSSKSRAASRSLSNSSSKNSPTLFSSSKLSTPFNTISPSFAETGEAISSLGFV